MPFVAEMDIESYGSVYDSINSFFKHASTQK